VEAQEEEEEEEAGEADGEADDAKDEAAEPPKKRARKAAAPKAAKSPKKAAKGAADGAKKRTVKKKQHPKTMDMVVEAIENLSDRKGSSVQAIKSYIIQNFKTVRADMLKSMLRRALAGALASGAVTRPKGQAETQVMSGRYLLGKTAKKDEEEEVMPKESKRAQEAKAQAKAKKASKKKAAKKPVKKVYKPVAKKASPKKKPVKKGKKGRK